MCGIVGAFGVTAATSVVHAGLCRLEYRGYDSAGIAWAEPQGIEVLKATGRVVNLQIPISEATSAVGHTRWATHGGVTVENAHPHLDGTGNYAVVHNGTLDNHSSLRDGLSGHTFQSETDTEVLAHLYEQQRTQHDSLEALRSVVSQVNGSWAMVFMDPTGELAFACEKTPLVIGVLDSGFIIASDVTAIVEHTRRVIFLEDGDHGTIGKSGLNLYDGSGQAKPGLATTIDWTIEAAEKGGYDHFMEKELHEVPSALNQVLAGRVRLDPLRVDVLPASLLDVKRIKLIGCGSSYHAARMGAIAFEEWAGIPTQACLAHELLERPLLDESGTLFVAISQSGETLDTLQAVRRLRSAGYGVVGVCNVQGSTLTRLADDTVLVRVGPEIAVASTKAVIGQALVLQLMALQAGIQREALPRAELRDLARGLMHAPRDAEAVLRSDVSNMASKLVAAKHVFFLGSHDGDAVAREAALKFKEITYRPAEAYHASELKHGPFALLDERTAVVMCTPNELVSREIGARGADTYELGFSGLPALLQSMRLAFESAKILGTNIDQPRNLAKSVTVA